MTGRKNAYDTKIKPRLEEIKAWCRDGHIDKDICKTLGVSLATFYKWKAIKPEFSDALKTTKAIADIQVENALFKRALGYEFEEVTEEISNTNGNKSTKSKKTVKEVVADTTAQIFWLKNRRPDQWRQQPEADKDSSNIEKAAEALDKIAKGLPD